MEASTSNWEGPLWKMEVGAGFAGALLLCSLGLLTISIVAFGSLATALHPTLKVDSFEIVVGLVLLIPLHEGIHALCFMAFGGRPRFGVGFKDFLFYAYVGCRGQRFSRNQFMLVALAPLLLLDLLGVVLLPILPAFGAGVIFVLIVLNTAGAVGDLWSVATILQRPAWVHYLDSGSGFTAWAPAERAGESIRLRPPAGLDVPLLAWAGSWVGATLLGFLIVEGLVAVLLFHFKRIAVGPLVMAEVIERPDGWTIQHYYVSSLAVAAALGTGTTILMSVLRARRRRPTDEAADSNTA